MTLIRRPSPFREIRRGTFTRTIALPEGLEPDRAQGAPASPADTGPTEA
jgi:hypothetical protein